MRALFRALRAKFLIVLSLELLTNPPLFVERPLIGRI